MRTMSARLINATADFKTGEGGVVNGIWQRGTPTQLVSDVPCSFHPGSASDAKADGRDVPETTHTLFVNASELAGVDLPVKHPVTVAVTCQGNVYRCEVVGRSLDLGGRGRVLQINLRESSIGEVST